MKSAAKIYAANLLVNAMGGGASSVLFKNQEEEAFFQEELIAIADKIMPEVSASTLDDCISEAIKRSNK